MMSHFVLAIYILAFAMGCGSIMLFLTLAVKLHSRLLRRYTIFQALFLGLMMLGFLETYLFLLGENREGDGFLLLYLLLFVWGALTIMHLPRFVLAFLRRVPGRKWDSLLAFAAAALAVAPAVTLAITGSGQERNAGLMCVLECLWAPLVTACVAICLWLLHRDRQRVPDGLERQVLQAMRRLTIAFSPAIVIDILQPRIWDAWPAFPYGLKLTVFYHLAWTIVGLYFVHRHFFPRFEIVHTRILDERVVARYSISKREQEIVRCLMDGLSPVEIAERLFIAYKTVDNHVSNIYRKTGVNSRKALLRLFR